MIEVDGIPSKVLKLFILSLFENGSVQVNDRKIVPWNNNDRYDKNKIWENNKNDFERYGLLKTIETESGDVFHEVDSNLGAQVWRKVVEIMSRKIIKESVVEKPVVKTTKLSKIEIDMLLKKKDHLEKERQEAMRSVSIAQINNRGYYTSVKVKEGYAERLSLIIDKIDTELENNKMFGV